MLVKLDHFPNFRDENKKYLKPPPRDETTDNHRITTEILALTPTNKKTEVFAANEQGIFSGQKFKLLNAWVSLLATSFLYLIN